MEPWVWPPADTGDWAIWIWTLVFALGLALAAIGWIKNR